MELYKKQILDDEKYLRYKDLINVLFSDGVKYSAEEAEEKINGYLNGKESE
ncbi:MAG: hypothetical protein IJR45_01985 [Firmicutes bacterium]|nr:hypothetical protein [Bacillota bacterium]MBQ9604160.1 hypothetical protein [Bacillota bacterium]